MSEKSITNFGKRVKEIRTHLNINQKAFAETVGVATYYLNEIERGEKNPDYDFLLKISTLHNVNLNFLFHGTGEMFLAENTTTNDRIKDDWESIDEISTVEDLLWILDNSSFFKHIMLAKADKLFNENEGIILKQLKKNISPNK